MSRGLGSYCVDRTFYDSQGNQVGVCRGDWRYSPNFYYYGSCPWEDNPNAKKLSLSDSSQFNWLFEGLLNEVGLQDEIEVLGNRGDKIYNIKADGQRLILNEYSQGSVDKTITINDCGYENVGMVTIPAKGVLLVNSNVIVTNARPLPNDVTIIKEGPDNYVVAEFNSPVTCNGVVKETRKAELSKNVLEKILSWFKGIIGLDD